MSPLVLDVPVCWIEIVQFFVLKKASRASKSITQNYFQTAGTPGTTEITASLQ